MALAKEARAVRRISDPRTALAKTMYRRWSRVFLFGRGERLRGRSFEKWSAFFGDRGALVLRRLPFCGKEKCVLLEMISLDWLVQQQEDSKSL